MSTFLKILFAAALLLMPHMITSAHAQDAAEAEVKKLPIYIEDVRVFGRWTIDDNTGVYRGIIVRSGTDTVTARFFLQWLMAGADGTQSIHSTTEIKELSELKTNIVDYRIEMDADGLAMFIDTLNIATDDDTTFELFINSPEDYEFSPSTN